ncbi:hypothetical protein ACP4OV_019163 [Aristida adscensionis]
MVLWAGRRHWCRRSRRGTRTARNLHIALNVLLFIWQIPTGLEIVGKVFEFTTWP